MKTKDENLTTVAILVLAIVPWLSGLVIAQGFWQTAFALFPPYAWYLTVQRAMMGLGWI